jgi:hypothetical protein
MQGTVSRGVSGAAMLLLWPSSALSGRALFIAATTPT